MCIRDRAYDLGLRKVKAYVKGPGNGRESAIRTIHGAGIEVTEIIDVTPVSYTHLDVYKRQQLSLWLDVIMIFKIKMRKKYENSRN